jgi:protein YibB
MSKISIVTAFFDIGRGEWTPDKGLPHYLHRTTDTYLERFSHLAKLENDITIFTTDDLKYKVLDICKDRMDRTNILPIDVKEYFAAMRDSIIKVQKSPEFQNKVNPQQAKNPEYWNPDYVLVTNLKAHFTDIAVQEGYTKNDLVAWIDFGYCRSEKNIPDSKLWSYDFDPTKIHLFNYKSCDNVAIEQAVLNNDVYILGAKVVAHKDMWPKMSNLMNESFVDLQNKNLVDDDQGLWLQSYIKEPESFELHKIPDHQFGHDPFVLFNEFNNE